MIVNDFGDVVNKKGIRPPKKVEFQIEKTCKTCAVADDQGRSKCFACGGWRPKPELVPKGWIREPGPRVMILVED